MEKNILKFFEAKCSVGELLTVFFFLVKNLKMSKMSLEKHVWNDALRILFCGFDENVFSENVLGRHVGKRCIPTTSWDPGKNL